jgi:hypothetical protein
MLIGVLIIYLPVNAVEAIAMTCISLTAAAVALYATRKPRSELEPKLRNTGK